MLACLGICPACFFEWLFVSAERQIRPATNLLGPPETQNNGAVSQKWSSWCEEGTKWRRGAAKPREHQQYPAQQHRSQCLPQGCQRSLEIKRVPLQNLGNIFFWILPAHGKYLLCTKNSIMKAQDIFLWTLPAHSKCTRVAKTRLWEIIWHRKYFHMGGSAHNVNQEHLFLWTYSGAPDI